MHNASPEANFNALKGDKGLSNRSSDHGQVPELADEQESI